jgi:hypothetical protein
MLRDHLIAGATVSLQASLGVPWCTGKPRSETGDKEDH